MSIIPFTRAEPEYVRWDRDHVHHQYADILARIRSGVRVSWKAGEYRVHDETGRVVMLTSDPSKALNVYQFRCSIAHQARELAESGRDCLGLTPAIARW